MSDPITAQSFMAGLSCNSGTREPAPPPVEGETEHTPGPWEACNCGKDDLGCGYVFGDSGNVYVAKVLSAKNDINDVDPVPKDEMARANAALIARAPDMAAEIARLTRESANEVEFLSECVGPEHDAQGVPYMRCTPDLPEYVAKLVRELAEAREQLADADRTLAGFVRAVREARETMLEIRRAAKNDERRDYIVALCDAWLTPALAALPPARVLTEGGQ